jgi:hypothetical protein
VDAAAERIYALTALGFHSESRVPVTAKLSRKFYERLGDDIAGELVDWFNAVDATYQQQLREINELNWERFKAQLEATRAELRGEMAAMRAELRSEMAAMRADLLKWMFVYWTGTVVTLGGLIIGMAVFGPK